jgi:hypothetical protein
VTSEGLYTAAAVIATVAGIAAAVGAAPHQPQPRKWYTAAAALVAVAFIVLAIGFFAPSATPEALPDTGSNPGDSVENDPGDSVENESGPDDMSPPEQAAPAQPEGPQYLADLTAVSGTVFTDNISLAGRSYPHSILMYCTEDSNSLRYNVADMDTFTATIGIPDDEDAAGIVVDMSFQDEARRPLGETVSVALGQPQQVSINLGNAVQLDIGCIGRVGLTGGGTIGVGFGDAAVSS